MNSLLDQIISETSRAYDRLSRDADAVPTDVERPPVVGPETPIAYVGSEIADAFGMRDLPNTVVVDSPAKLDTKRNGATAGDFVHETQTTDSRFRNVSTGWTSRVNDSADQSVMTYSDARNWLESERGAVSDIVAPLNRFRPIVRHDTFLVEDSETGRAYRLTDSAIGQFLSRAVPRDRHVGQFGARILAENQPDLLAEYVERESDGDSDKSVFVRTRGDSIRAFLSDQYAVIDNRWFLDQLESIVPGGLVSHSRGDGDSVYFNILIPDSIRAESDSDYGGMLACGNSEIGARRLSSLPSVFRAICMNGCIWGERKGIAFVRKVHRGEIDLAELREEIRANLNAQIPLLDSGIDTMMELRETETAIPAREVLASAIWETERQISRTQADSMLLAHAIERTETGTTAFDVVQSVTRAAQGFGAAEQETAERFAGDMLEWSDSDWSRVFSRAESIDEKQLKRVYQTVSV